MGHHEEYPMNGRERLLTSLAGRTVDRPPVMEIDFAPVKEAFGVEFPSWDDFLAGGQAKQRALAKTMEINQRIIEEFAWDGIILLRPAQDAEGIAAAKKAFGDHTAIGGILWEGVWSIDIIRDWQQFSEDLFDHPENLHAKAEQYCQIGLDRIDRMVGAGADFILIASDVGFNGGPFLSPDQFRIFVTPYVARLCQRIRDRGAIPMYHSDGMIMPIIDQLMDAGVAVLQSIDPMAGMDIRVVKELTRGRMSLMGNVRCDYLQHGTPEQITESALYSLEHGSPGGGFIFSSSNTIFDGVPVENYRLMLSVFRQWCKQQKGRSYE